MDARIPFATRRGAAWRPLAIALSALLALGACTGSPGPDGSSGKPVVFGAFATQIEEPWDGVIHAALQAEADAGRIEYTFADDIGYAGDMERVLRETAEQDHPAIIFGDAFGNEDAVRAVAADYPDIAFVFGSGGGPAEPNFSVFDNWIHEPAYLAGMIAGGVTQTNVVGVVGGYPVPEVNRIVNAFIAGAQETNPDVEVKVTFLNSWFDPAAAKADTIEVPVQVDGKLKAKFTAPADSTQDQLKGMALALPELKGLTPKKVIVVPGKLVNVVV